MKTYISGPISGRPNGNQEEFSRAAEHLIISKRIPVNPHDVCALLPASSTWRDYMRECIIALCRCQEIYMLRGWWRSRGARVEWMLARILGLKIRYEGKPVKCCATCESGTVCLRCYNEFYPYWKPKS